jgi:hypothetical protein
MRRFVCPRSGERQAEERNMEGTPTGTSWALQTPVTRWRALAASLLLSGSTLVSAPAVGGEIPFYATNNGSSDACIACIGPWGRVSSFSGQTIPSSAVRLNFYNADINIFSQGIALSQVTPIQR